MCPSADGRRSAAIFATVELLSTGAYRLAGPGDTLLKSFSNRTPPQTPVGELTMLRRSSGWLEKGYSTSLLIPYPHRRLARTHMIVLFPAFTRLRDFLDKSISTVITTVLRSASRGKTCTISTHATQRSHALYGGRITRGGYAVYCYRCCYCAQRVCCAKTDETQLLLFGEGGVVWAKGNHEV